MPLRVHYTKEALEKWLVGRFPETDWSPVIEELPPIVWRHRWNYLAEKFGLPYKRSHMQNLDSQGVGPSSYC